MRRQDSRAIVSAAEHVGEHSGGVWGIGTASTGRGADSTGGTGCGLAQADSSSASAGSITTGDRQGGGVLIGDPAVLGGDAGRLGSGSSERGSGLLGMPRL